MKYYFHYVLLLVSLIILGGHVFSVTQSVKPFELSFYANETYFVPSKIVAGQDVEWTVTVNDDTDIILPKEARDVNLSLSDGGVPFVEEKMRPMSIGPEDSFLVEKSVSEVKQVRVSGAVGDFDRAVVTFRTPGPKVVEDVVNDSVKYVRVYSDVTFHYHDVHVSTMFTERADLVSRLYLVNDSGRFDVTSDISYDVGFDDSDSDGISDSVHWVIPQLSEKEFEVVLESIDIYTAEAISENNWTILFDTTKSGSLTVHNLRPDIMNLEGIYCYRGSFVKKDNVVYPSLSNEYTLSTYWNSSECSRGKVVYTTSRYAPDELALELGFEGRTILLKPKDYYQPLGSTLDLDHPMFSFKLCSFNDSYVHCDARQNEIGYDGIEVGIDGETIKYLNIPVSDVDPIITDAHMTVMTSSNKPSAVLGLVQGFGTPGASVAPKGAKDNLFTFTGGHVIVYDNLSVSLDMNFQHDVKGAGYGVFSKTYGTQPVFAMGGELGLYTQSGELIKSKNLSAGEVFNDIVVSDIISPSLTYKLDGKAVDYYALDSSSKEIRFTLPYDVAYDENSTCYVYAAVNKKGARRDLVLSTTSGESTVDTFALTTTNEVVYDGYDDLPNAYQCLGCNDVNRIIFNGKKLRMPATVPAKECYLNSGLGYFGDASGLTANITFGKTTTLIPMDDVTHTVTYHDVVSDDGSFEDVIPVSTGVTVDTGLDLRGNDVCSLVIPFNKNPDAYGNLYVTLNDHEYDVDENMIDVSNLVTYSSGAESPDSSSCAGCGGRTVDVPLDMLDLPSDIPANTCYLNTSLNYFKADATGLTVQLGQTVYPVNTSGVDANTTIRLHASGFNGPDGKLYNFAKLVSDGEQIDYLLRDIAPVGGVKAEKCYVSVPVCFSGSNNGTLVMGFSQGGQYSVSGTNVVTECGSGFSDVDVEVQCAKVNRTNRMYVFCEGCSDTNYYYIGVDSSTDTNNSIYYNSTSDQNVYPSSDYAFEVWSNTSLYTQSVLTEVSCDEIESVDYATYSCPLCSEDGFNLIFDGYEPFVSVFSNTSTNNDLVETFVSCDDASGPITVGCDDCQGYNMLSDDGKPVVRARTHTLSGEPVQIKYDCSKLDFLGNVTINCIGCNESNYLIDDAYLGDSSTYVRGEDQYLGPALDMSVYSNSSLLYDTVGVPVDCQSVEKSNNVSFYCPGCTATDGYNVILMNTTPSYTWASTNGGIDYDSLLSRNAILKVLVVSGEQYDEVVTIDDMQRVQLYYPNLTLVASAYMERPIMDVKTGRLYPSVVGRQVVVLTTDALVVLDSNMEEMRRWNLGGTTLAVQGGIDSDSILVGLYNGTVMSCDVESCDSVGSFGSVKRIYTGAFTDDDQVVVLDGSNVLHVLSETFTPVTELALLQDVRDVYAGDVSGDGRDEIIALSPEGYSVYSLSSMQSLDIHIGATKVFSTSTGFESVDLNEISDALNSYLSACSGMCTVPVRFASGEQASVLVKDMEVTFNYNASDVLNTNDHVARLEKTEGLSPFEPVRYDALRLDYTKRPLLDLYVRYITKQFDFASDFDSTVFNSVQCPVIGGILDLGYTSGTNAVGCDRDYYIPHYFNRESDYIWWRNQTFVPVLSNETVDENPTVYTKTVKLYANYSEIFFDEVTNVRLNFSVDKEGIAENYTFSIDEGDGFVSVQPIPVGSRCTYTRRVVSGQNLSICAVNNGTLQFSVIQPVLNYTLQKVEFRISMDTNAPPIIHEFSVQPRHEVWGVPMNFSINITDSDDAYVTLQVYKGGWKNFSTQSLFAPDGLVNFSVSFDSSYVGMNQYRFVVLDYSGEDVFHTTITETGMFEIQKRPLKYVSNNFDSGMLSVYMQDNFTSEGPATPIMCRLYIDGVFVDTAMSAGDACDFVMSELAAPGSHTWRVEVVNEREYLDFKTSEEVVDIEGEAASFNIFMDDFYNRTEQVRMKAQIRASNPLQDVSGIPCIWSVDGNLLGESVTNADGVCTYVWNTSCDNLPRVYKITAIANVSGGNIDLVSSEAVKYVNLVDFLNLTIVNPVADSVLKDNGDSVTFAMVAEDSCGEVSDDSLLMWKIDSSATRWFGRNFTYIVPGDAYGGLTITATKNSPYYSTVYEDSVYIDLDDVVRVQLYVPDILNRTITPSSDYFPLRASILTGSGKRLNESDYVGERSGHTCKWYVDDVLLGVSLTDENGDCIFTWNADCGYKAGMHQLKVILERNETTLPYPYYPLAGEQSLKYVRLLDKNAILISDLPAQNSEYYLVDEVKLDYILEDSCKNSIVNSLSEQVVGHNLYLTDGSFVMFDRVPIRPSGTIEFWMKLRNMSSTQGTVSLYDTSAPYSLLRQYLNVLDNGMIQYYLNYDSGKEIVLNSTVNIQFSKWNHVAVSYSKSGDSLYVNLYVNGKASGSAVRHDASSEGVVYLNPYVGMKALTETGTTSGSIDEVRIYNRSMDDSEIKASYNAGRGHSALSVDGSTIFYASFNDSYVDLVNNKTGNVNGIVGFGGVLDLYDAEWSYADNDSSDTITNGWLVNYNAYGPGTISLFTYSDVYSALPVIRDVLFRRKSGIVAYDFPYIIQPESTINFSCQIGYFDRTGSIIDEITDKQGYNVTLVVDEGTVQEWKSVQQTNENGTAIFNHSFGPIGGEHTIKCFIDSDPGRYTDVLPSLASVTQKTVTPTEVQINLFSDNREVDTNPESSNYCGHFVDKDTVFRASSDYIREPRMLYLGMTPYVYDQHGDKVILDDVNITVDIIDGNGVKKDSVSCVSNLTEYLSRADIPFSMPQENICDNYTSFVCLTNWTAGQLPVGNYTLQVTAHKDGGWTSTTVRHNISLYGILNVDFIVPSPVSDQTHFWSHLAYTLKVNVTDDLGNVVNSSYVTAKYWYRHRNHLSAYPPDSSYLIGYGDGKYHDVLFDIPSEPYVLHENYRQYTWDVRVHVWGPYYSSDSVYTKYKSYSDREWDVMNRQHNDRAFPYIMHLTEPVILQPTEEVVCPKNVTKPELNVTCRVRRNYDGVTVWNSFPVYMKCIGCTQPVNTDERMDLTDVNGEVSFSYDMSGEAYNKDYTFQCRYANHSFYRTYGNYTTDSVSFKWLQVCGSGNCNNDGICNAGETCLMCPYDCGYQYLLPNYIPPGQEDDPPMCGCNYDNKCDVQYESSVTYCQDCNLSEQPPEITYFRSYQPSTGTDEDYYVKNTDVIRLGFEASDVDDDIVAATIVNDKDPPSTWKFDYLDSRGIHTLRMDDPPSSAKTDGPVTTSLNSFPVVYSLSVTDSRGRETSQNITVTFDAKPPTISDVSIDKDLYREGEDISIMLKIGNDNVDTLKDVKVYCPGYGSGGDWISLSHFSGDIWKGTVKAADLSDGSNNGVGIVRVRAEDKAEWVVDETFMTYNIDKTPPVVDNPRITSTDCDSYDPEYASAPQWLATSAEGASCGKTISFQASVTDAESGLGRVYVAIDGAERGCSETYSGETTSVTYTCDYEAREPHRSAPAYPFQICAADKVGNENCVTNEDLEAFIDNNAPVINLDTSSLVYLKESATHTASATISDGPSHVDPATVQWENCPTGFICAAFTSPSTGAYTSDITVSGAQDGSYAINLAAKDYLGRKQTVIQNVIVDNTAPVVKIYYPTGESVVGSNLAAIIAFEEVNPQLSASYYYLSPDGCTGPGYNLESGNMTYSHSMPADTATQYYLCAHAEDKSGMTGDAQVQFMVDTIAPTISFVSPTQGSTISGDINVRAEVTDAQGHLDTDSVKFCYYKVGTTICTPTTSMAESAGDFTTGLLDTQGWAGDGDYKLRIVAKDTAQPANTASAEITVTLDNTPPDIEITQPVDGAPVTGTFVVRANVDDLHLDAGSIRCGLSLPVGTLMDNVVDSTYGCNLDSTVVPDSADAYVYVTAQDSEGNKKTDQVSVYIDNHPPEITFVDVVEDVMKPPGSITINTDATDPYFENGISRCEVYISQNSVLDGNDPLAGNLGPDCQGSLDLTQGYGGGNKYVFVNVVDKVGHEAYAYDTLYIDLTGPLVLNLTSNANDVVGDESIVRFTVHVEDDYDVSMVYIYNLNNKAGTKQEMAFLPGSGTPLNGLYYVDLIPKVLSCSGECALQVEGVDSVGNADQSNVYTLNVDTVPPTVKTLEVYKEGRAREYLNANMVVDVFSDIDDNYQVTEARISCNDNPALQMINVTPLSESTRWKFTTRLSVLGCVAEGAVNLTVKGIDLVGLSSAKSKDVFIDNTNPVILNFTSDLIDPYVNSEQEITFTVRARDNESGIDRVVLYGAFEGAGYAMHHEGNLYVLNVTPAMLGCDAACNVNLTVNAKAYDKAGNSVTRSLHIVVDNIPPHLERFEFLNGTQYNSDFGVDIVSPDDDVTFNVNVTDSNPIYYVYLHAIDGPVIAPPNNLRMNMTYDGALSKTGFSVKTSPASFAAFNGTYLFEAFAYDMADNYANVSKILYVAPGVVFINDIFRSGEGPIEVNATSVDIRVNVTGLPMFGDIWITHESGQVFHFDNLSSVDKDSDFMKDIFVYKLDFVPPFEGYYHVNATMATQYVTSKFQNEFMFKAIGNTPGYTRIQYVNPAYVAGVNATVNKTAQGRVVFKNTGIVRLYDPTVRIITDEGIAVEPAYAGTCSEVLSPNESCMYGFNLTFDCSAEDSTITAIVEWRNPDSTISYGIARYNVTVQSNAIFGMVSTGMHVSPVLVNSWHELGSMKLRSQGNAPLTDVRITAVNDTNTSLAIKPGVIPVLAPRLSSEVNVSVLPTVPGPHSGTITLNAQGCLNISRCSKTVDYEITAFDKVEIKMAKLSDIDKADRVQPLQCSVRRLLGAGLVADYPIMFLDDTAILGTVNASGDGIATYMWNVTGVDVGEHAVGCRIEPYGYYLVNASEVTQDVLVYGTLGEVSVIRTVNAEQLYWSDEVDKHFTRLQATVRDSFGYPVDEALVKFYSNATMSGVMEEVGSCVTDISGLCSYDWNPSVTRPGKFALEFNATKNLYHTSDTFSMDVKVLGGEHVNIVSPATNTVYEVDKRPTAIFDMQLYDGNNTDITTMANFSLTWKVYNESGVMVKTFSSKHVEDIIGADYEVGLYKVNLTVKYNGQILSDSIDFRVIGSGMVVTMVSQDTMSVDRDDAYASVPSVRFTPLVEDAAGPLDRARVELFLGDYGTLVGNCTTNLSGMCDVFYNPDEYVEAGNYSIHSLVYREGYPQINQTLSYLAVYSYITPSFTLPAERTFYDVRGESPLVYSCDVLDATTRLLIDKEGIEGSMTEIMPAYHESLDIDNDGYVWTDHNGTVRAYLLDWEVSGSGTVNFSNGLVFESQGTVSVSTTLRKQYDTMQYMDVKVIKQPGMTYSITVSNATGDYTVVSMETQNEMTVPLSSFSFDMINITVTGTGVLNVTSLMFKELSDRGTLILGSSTILNSDYPDNSTWGDMEHLVIEPVPDNGWYAAQCAALRNFSIRGNGSFGINLSCASQMSQFEFGWHYPGVKDVRNYSALGMYIYSPMEKLNFSIILTDGVARSTLVTSGYAGWKYVQFNLSNTTIDKSRLQGIIIKIRIPGKVPALAWAYVDEVRLIRDVTSNIAGQLRFGWYERLAGGHRIECNVDDQGFYKVVNGTIQKQFVIVSDTKKSENENLKVNDLFSFSTTFDIPRLERYVLAMSDYDGVLDWLDIYSLSSEKMYLQLSTNGTFISFNVTGGNSSVVEIGPGEIVHVPLYYRMGGRTTADINKSFIQHILVTNPVLDERTVVTYNVSLFDAMLEVLDPVSGNPLIGVEADDDLKGTLRIRLSPSASQFQLEDYVGYQAYVGGNECEMRDVDKGTDVTFTCIVPYLQGNPITNEFMVDVDLYTNFTVGKMLYTTAGKIVKTEPDAVLYNDVTPPTFEKVFVPITNLSSNKQMKVNVTDNAGVDAVWGYMFEPGKKRIVKGENKYDNLGGVFGISASVDLDSFVKSAVLRVRDSSQSAVNLSALYEGVPVFNNTGSLGLSRSFGTSYYPDTIYREDARSMRASVVIEGSSMLYYYLPYGSKVTNFAMDIDGLRTYYTYHGSSQVIPDLADSRYYVVDYVARKIVILSDQLRYIGQVGFADMGLNDTKIDAGIAEDGVLKLIDSTQQYLYSYNVTDPVDLTYLVNVEDFEGAAYSVGNVTKKAWYVRGATAGPYAALKTSGQYSMAVDYTFANGTFMVFLGGMSVNLDGRTLTFDVRRSATDDVGAEIVMTDGSSCRTKQTFVVKDTWRTITVDLDRVDSNGCDLSNIRNISLAFTKLSDTAGTDKVFVDTFVLEKDKPFFTQTDRKSLASMNLLRMQAPLYDGLVYAFDAQSKELVTYNSSSGAVSRQILNDSEHWFTPQDIETEKSGHSTLLYGVDAGLGKVFVFNLTDNVTVSLFTFGNEGTLDDAFVQPLGLGVDSKHIYVADTANNKVQIFNKDMTFNASVDAYRPKDVYVSGSKFVFFDGTELKEYEWADSKPVLAVMSDNYGPIRARSLTIDIGNDQKKGLAGKTVNREYYSVREFDTKTMSNSTQTEMARAMNLVLSRCRKRVMNSDGNKYCVVPVNVTTKGRVNITETAVRYVADQFSKDFSGMVNDELAKGNGLVNITLITAEPYNWSKINATLTIEYYPEQAKDAYAVTDGLWTRTYSGLEKSGNYEMLLYASDTSGLVSKRYAEMYNYGLMTFKYNGNRNDPGIVIGLRLRGARVNDSLLDVKLNNSGNVSQRIYEMQYDVVTDLDMNNSETGAEEYARVWFKNVSFVERVDNLTNDTYAEDPFVFMRVPLFNLSLPNYIGGPPYLGSIALHGISINSSFASMQSVEVLFNYSNMFDELVKAGYVLDEERVYIFKCPEYDVRNCINSSWVRLNVSKDMEGHIIRANSTSTSTYIVAEDMSVGTPQDKKEENTDSSSRSSSGSSGRNSNSGGGFVPTGTMLASTGFCGDGACDGILGENSTSCPEDCTPHITVRSVCGNDLCEMGEDIYNCPKDCSRKSFSIKSNIVYSTLYAGDQREFLLEVSNLVQEPVTFDVMASDSLKGLVSFNMTELKVEGDSMAYVRVNMHVPEGTAPGLIQGQIMVDAPSGTLSVPVSLSVSDTSTMLKSLFTLKTEIFNDMLEPNDELQVNIVVIYPQGYTESYSMDVTTLVRDLETNYVLYNETMPVMVNKTQSFTSNVTIANYSLGKYTFESYLQYNGVQIASASDMFFVKRVFWKSRRFIVSVTTLLGFLVAVLLLYGLFVLRMFRRSRQRYPSPNFNLLPQKTEDDFWLGTIAGTKKKAYYDPNDLTTHMLVAGSTGAGKSVAASVFVEEALMKKVPVVVFDPTSQWTGFVKQCKDKYVLKYYNEFGMTENDVRSFSGLIYNVENPDVKIDFREYMNPGEVTVFNLSKLKTGEYDVAVRHIVDTIFAMQWPESSELKLVLVFDEVHRLLEKYGGSGGYIALEKATREFRKWGIGIVMVSQVSADFKEAIQGNVLTEIQLNTKSMEDIKKIGSKYGKEFSSRITRQGIGVGLIQNPKYNNGLPWFVHLRPPVHSPHKLESEELEIYMKYAGELLEIEQYVKKHFKGDELDDIMLEVNLTKAKLKQGKFRMVEIYLSTLRERFKK